MGVVEYRAKIGEYRTSKYFTCIKTLGPLWFLKKFQKLKNFFFKIIIS